MLFIIGLLKVVLVIVCILIVLLVMMQRPKQEGLGAAFAQGMMNEIGGAHTANILQKGTTYLGIMFFGISLLLSVLISYDARASRALGEAAAESIEGKSVGTAGEPTMPLDIGNVPGVDKPLGGAEGGTETPEGGTTPEGGDVKLEDGPETPVSNENPDNPGGEAPEAPSGGGADGATSGETTPAPPAPGGGDLETPSGGGAPAQP